MMRSTAIVDNLIPLQDAAYSIWVHWESTVVSDRIKAKIAAGKVTMALLRLGGYVAKFDQNQPRVPAGVATGGQWLGTNRRHLAGKWNERSRDVCEAQYELDMFQCSMVP